jgi:hypothetical protein
MQPVKIKRADPATHAKESPSCEIPPEEKDICLQFLAFPDSFAIDWFAGVPQVSPSRLISALAFLERRQWIIARPGEKGVYEWTKKLPREEIIGGRLLPLCRESPAAASPCNERDITESRATFAAGGNTGTGPGRRFSGRPAGRGKPQNFICDPPLRMPAEICF